MEVGREALAFTNPGARYVVLTDRATAPKLEKDFEVEVLAPKGAPLMQQYIIAQGRYEEKADPGLVVLAASDCVAGRDLSAALQHNMAITYRRRGKSLINNVAYVEDHDRAAWFLNRALKLIKPEFSEFWGDQKAWEDALGPFETWEPLDNRAEGVRVAKPDGRCIHLYSCRTHNYFPKRSGAWGIAAKQAYLVHYKGSRKLNMVASVKFNVLRQGPMPDWQFLKEEASRRSHVLPMEDRRTLAPSPSEEKDIGG